MVHARSPPSPATSCRQYSCGPNSPKHASPSSMVPPAAGITPHGGQSDAHESGVSSPPHSPSPQVAGPAPYESSAVRSPLKLLRSTAPEMPATLPELVYWWNAQLLH